MPQSSIISVAIVDDHPMIRLGVEGILEREEGMELVAEAEDGATILKILESQPQPAVLILDIVLGGMSGIDLIPRIRSLAPSSEVVMYSSIESPETIQRALISGARAYVLKRDSLKELVKAVRMAHQGKTYLSPTVSPIVLDRLVRGSDNENNLANLTSREYEVANLLAQGLDPMKIGESLFISPKTVRVHRTNIMRKLSCQNLSQLLIRLQDYFPG
jgi:DNA-binding NarL/FixJ family response regulator